MRRSQLEIQVTASRQTVISKHCLQGQIPEEAAPRTKTISDLRGDTV